MISTRAGGCICEKPPAGIDTNNMRLPSLFAPRRRLMGRATATGPSYAHGRVPLLRAFTISTSVSASQRAHQRRAQLQPAEPPGDVRLLRKWLLNNPHPDKSARATSGGESGGLLVSTSVTRRGAWPTPTGSSSCAAADRRADRRATARNGGRCRADARGASLARARVGTLPEARDIYGARRGSSTRRPLEGRGSRHRARATCASSDTPARAGKAGSGRRRLCLHPEGVQESSLRRHSPTRDQTGCQ